MQSTCSAETPSMAARIPGTSVPKPSQPSRGLSSTTTGRSPAAPMALKQDFWSILDHTTYRPSGRIWRRAKKTSVIVRPVAAGNTQQAFAALMPAMWIASSARYRVSWTSREDPAAFGCSAMTSPLRPMPCVSPKCRWRTRLLRTRPSRSPTPTLPMKLLVSKDATSSRNICMDASSQPSSGSLLCVSSAVMVLDLELRACSACTA
mmetsp:Transcript_37485/g.104163  ORF Transcript_37485/g.104163 Transcript_37485/m.104163 type:complete len:206 (-) Transcript_37485:113-730(-)